MGCKKCLGKGNAHKEQSLNSAYQGGQLGQDVPKMISPNKSGLPFILTRNKSLQHGRSSSCIGIE